MFQMNSFRNGPPKKIKCVSDSHSVRSYFLQFHGLQPARLLSPWNSPGKSTEVSCHAFSKRRSNDLPNQFVAEPSPEFRSSHAQIKTTSHQSAQRLPFCLQENHKSLLQQPSALDNRPVTLVTSVIICKYAQKLCLLTFISPLASLLPNYPPPLSTVHFQGSAAFIRVRRGFREHQSKDFQIACFRG